LFTLVALHRLLLLGLRHLQHHLLQVYHLYLLFCHILLCLHGHLFYHLFHDLELHATEAATCFASLVQHYDLCITALKHTEGGGEAASAATNATTDDPDVLQTSTFASPPEPLTPAERLEMLSVLQKDAAEVDDVVSEIRERGAEMEFLIASISAHMALLREERAALAAAFDTLMAVANATHTQLTATKAFLTSWAAERTAIAHGIEEWDSLRAFYDAFDGAYSALVLEVAARRARHERAKKKAKDYRENRLPKFLGYFERVLGGEASKGGEYLYGGQLTYADLVLFQTVDGVSFAFPKCVGSLKASGKYEKVFGLYERVKGREKIKSYLESERRQKYSMGIYRHYPELDDK